ncbi:hypothetical protein [Vibrio sonorensis]|uniref:hypothetical protein n=1 Tax=Vibrio sonorensis TaxID=1004316 RepID=UPI0008D99710|nr:hypothetical protein [Vibrio sonorensis]
MANPAIPTTYEEWKHCIVTDCGVDLTPQYIEQRLNALQDKNDEHTKQFIRVYGEQHLLSVITWFKKAQATYQ